jgi:GntR family transcriptional regulator
MGEPRYRAIATDLAAKIRSGRYPAGAALPGQRELSDEYGVTLMTLRQALRALSDEGLVVQRPGSGTFVAPPKLAYQLDTLRSLAEDLSEQGLQVRTAVLGRALRKPPAAVAALFGARPALRLERLRLVRGRPAVHQVSWVPQPYAGALRAVDFTATSLYAALADLGVAVARASEAIRPEALGGTVARHLQTPAGTPVFVSDRTTYGIDGSAVVVDRATILGTVMEIRAERAAAGLSLRWRPVRR